METNLILQFLDVYFYTYLVLFTMNIIMTLFNEEWKTNRENAIKNGSLKTETTLSEAVGGVIIRTFNTFNLIR